MIFTARNCNLFPIFAKVFSCLNVDVVVTRPPSSDTVKSSRDLLLRRSTSPFLYQWHREEKPMPARAELSDQNRVLTLIDAQLEDQGTYVCTVSRGSNAKDSKSFYLVLGGAPRKGVEG